MDEIKTILLSLKDDRLLISNQIKELENLYGYLVEIQWENSRSEDGKVKTLEDAVEIVTSVGSIRPSDHYEDKELSEEDFIEVRAKCEAAFRCLKIIIRHLLSLDEAQVQANKLPLKNIAVEVTVYCAYFRETCYWSDENIFQLNTDVSELLLKLCHCASWSDLLHGSETSLFPSGIAKPVLMHLIPQLTFKNWKKAPAVKFAFHWCLKQIKYPYLSDLIPEVLPPSLIITDDYMAANKVLGVDCLNHLIDNSIPTDLRLYGRAEVICNALEHLMYTHEPELIIALHPCLLKILDIVEADVLKPMAVSKSNRFDIIFHKILVDMEFEQRIIVRRALSQHLDGFIDKLGITVVKHSNRLISVIGHYLETYDGPEETSRINMLKALNKFLTVAWPRIPHHSVVLCKYLLKFIYDIKTDKTLTPEKVKNTLLQMAFDCLLLLKRCCPQLFEKESWTNWLSEHSIPGQDLIEDVLNLE